MQRALDVDVHDAIPERVVDRGELGARVDAGVRRQDVDAAVRRDAAAASASTEARSVTSVATRDARQLPSRARRPSARRARRVDVGEHDARALGGEHGGDAAPDAAGGAGDDRDLIGERLHAARRTDSTRAPRCSASSASDAKYAYSPDHASIGTVRARRALRGRVASRASPTRSRRPSDFTPERYAEAEALKWAVTGPISVAGARGGRRRRRDDPLGRGRRRPGVVVYGGYTAEDPYEWWDDESACDVYPAEGGSLRFDERTTLPTRPLIGCLAVAPAEGELHAKLQGRYGGNLDCREIRAGATRRPARRRTTAAGSTSATARR